MALSGIAYALYYGALALFGGSSYYDYYNYYSYDSYGNYNYSTMMYIPAGWYSLLHASKVVLAIDIMETKVMT